MARQTEVTYHKSLIQVQSHGKSDKGYAPNMEHEWDVNDERQHFRNAEHTHDDIIGTSVQVLVSWTLSESEDATTYKELTTALKTVPIMKA